MAPKVFGNKGAFEARYCPEKIFKDKIFGGMFRGKPRWMVAKEYAQPSATDSFPRRPTKPSPSWRKLYGGGHPPDAGERMEGHPAHGQHVARGS